MITRDFSPSPPSRHLLTSFVSHHRHGRRRSVTLGVEYLQRDEVLRESIQIVNTVILKKKKHSFFLSFFLLASHLTNGVLR